MAAGTFVGQAEAATTSFQNPYYIDADSNSITLEAKKGKATVDGADDTGLLLYDTTSTGTPADDCPNQVNSKECDYGQLYNPPTIRVSPGKAIDLTLINSLPASGPEISKLPQVEKNLEYVSQDTNLHYHGFNVSPLLGSDDVAMHVHSNVTPIPQSTDNTPTEIPILSSENADCPSKSNECTPTGGNYPGNNSFSPITDYGMKVDLPKIHQSGLFWYHPHVHTVSDNQVRAGMSGGIIVEGIEGDEYYPALKQLTTCLSILVRGEPECINENTPLIKTDGEKVMLFKDANPGDTSPSTKPFTLNGQYNPEIKIAPGGVQFWRIGNIGADAYLNLTFVDTSKTTNNHASGINLPTFYILARDGSTVTQPVSAESILLPPASRVEVLVIGGEQGSTYELVSFSTNNNPLPYGSPDTLSPVETNGNKTTGDYYSLASVSVIGDAVTYDLAASFGNDSCTSLENCIVSMQSKGDEILPDASTLANMPYCDGLPEYQCVVKENTENADDLFEFTFSKGDLKPGTVFTINNKLYEENRIDKVVNLGMNQEWTLLNSLGGGAHAFHMHQLDFAITEVIVPTNAVREENGSYYYDNYRAECSKATLPFKKKGKSKQGLKCKLLEHGYRDTINMPPNSSTVIRIPFLNPFITGIFVYHCHILGHEDNGMMQNIKVVDPDSYATQFIQEMIEAFKLDLEPGPAILPSAQKSLR